MIATMEGNANMPQSTDHPGAAHAAQTEIQATRLAAYLVPGDAVSETRYGAGVTCATPVELSVMLADLAARMAGVDLQPGEQLRLLIYVQPRENGVTARVDAAVTALLPGVTAHARPVASGVHYGADACTAAGLGVAIFTGLPAEEADPAEADPAEEAARVAEAVAGRAAYVTTAAEALGHAEVRTRARGGAGEVEGYTVVTCTCDDFTSDPAPEDVASASWRGHASLMIDRARQSAQAAVS